MKNRMLTLIKQRTISTSSKLQAITLLLTVYSFLSFVPQSSFGAENIKVLRFGMLVNGKGEVFKNAVLIIKSNRTESVGIDSPAIPDFVIIAQVVLFLERLHPSGSFLRLFPEKNQENFKSDD